MSAAGSSAWHRFFADTLNGADPEEVEVATQAALAALRHGGGQAGLPRARPPLPGDPRRRQDPRTVRRSVVTPGRRGMVRPARRATLRRSGALGLAARAALTKNLKDNLDVLADRIAGREFGGASRIGEVRAAVNEARIAAEAGRRLPGNVVLTITTYGGEARGLTRNMEHVRGVRARPGGTE